MATFGETQKRLNLQEQSQRLIGESAVKNHQVFSEQDSEKESLVFIDCRYVKIGFATSLNCPMGKTAE